MSALFLAMLVLTGGFLSACGTHDPGIPQLRLADESSAVAVEGGQSLSAPAMDGAGQPRETGQPSEVAGGGRETPVEEPAAKPKDRVEEPAASPGGEPAAEASEESKSKPLTLRRGWFTRAPREKPVPEEADGTEKSAADSDQAADAGSASSSRPKPPVKTAEPAEKPRDEGAPAAGAGMLRPGLEIWVSVMVGGKKEIDEPCVRVAEDGTLRLPMIGAVEAAGVSLLDFSARVTKAYREYFVDPQVSVDFVNDGSAAGFPWGSVTVLGKVANPGRIALPPTRDMTVIGAIQAAGGFGSSAKDSSVRVTRRTPDGKTEIKDVDLRSVGSRGRIAEDMTLNDGDIIYVPERIF